MTAQENADDARPTINRRALFSGLAAAAAVAPVKAVPAPDRYERTRQLADALAASMADIHGGEWRACVNHATAFVLIKPI